MTTIFFSGGNTGNTTPEKLIGDSVNVMPSYWYGVRKGQPNKRLSGLLERKAGNASARKASRRKDKDRG